MYLYGILLYDYKLSYLLFRGFHFPTSARCYPSKPLSTTVNEEQQSTVHVDTTWSPPCAGEIKTIIPR